MVLHPSGLEQPGGQLTVPEHPLPQSRSQEQADAQSTEPQDPPLQVMEQGPPEQTMGPSQAPPPQSTVHGPLQVIPAVHDWAPQKMVHGALPQEIAPVQLLLLQVSSQLDAWEQSMGPLQVPEAVQSIWHVRPGGQVQPLAQGSWQTLPEHPLVQAGGQIAPSGAGVTSTVVVSQGGRSGSGTSGAGPSDADRSGERSRAGRSWVRSGAGASGVRSPGPTSGPGASSGGRSAVASG